ncbi:MAG: hypothetical protein CVU56_18500 [Deltaproteobacteria bacterium HGW-Deltaproteobacteria-14]|nr:MAG: hypothetical protein CVU56_18500 [Deltaproteobacteria bacterium HGW-Deltaproteobacteria-14]
MLIAALIIGAAAVALIAIGYAWFRRGAVGEQTLARHLDVVPVSLARLRARLTRRFGSAVAEAPLTFAVDALNVTVSAVERGYLAVISWPLGPPGRLGELRIRPRRANAVTVGHRASPRTVRMIERPPNPLGDAAFDAALCLDCGMSVALPLLTPEVMRLALAADELTVADGVVRCVVGATAVDPAEAVNAIGAAVELALELARAAASPAEVLLAVGARTHRGAAARLRLLQELEDRYPGGDVLRDTLLAAQSDPAPIVRLEACQALGEDGRAGLWTLVLEDVAPESLRVAALLALTRGGQELDAAPAALARLIQPRTTPTLAAMTLRFMARRPAGPRDVTLACRALSSESEEVLLAAVALLEARADPAAARPLLDAAEDPAVPSRVRKHAKRVGDDLSRPAAALGVLRAVTAGHEGRA